MTVPAQPARVLVIEDNGLIAFAVGAALRQEGWTVVGPVGWLEQAVEASAKAEFDCAIIDAFLHGFHTDDVVANLVGRGKPFILTTGYGP